MAPVRNSIEERKARPRFESNRPRSTANSAPLLLRLPRIRVDQGKTTENPERFVATAEAENATEPFLKTAAPATAEPKVENHALNTQTTTAETSPTEKQTTERSWLDDWTNGVIIFLLTVVVVTTLLLVIQSPTFRQSKWFRGLVDEPIKDASPESLDTPKQFASEEVSKGTDTTSSPQVVPSESQLTNNQTTLSPLDGPKPLIIEGASNKVEAKASSVETKRTPVERERSPGSEFEDTDFDFGQIPNAQLPRSPTHDNLEARRDAPDLKAGRTDVLPQAPTQRRITETEYAESNVEQLLQLLKQQSGKSGGAGSSMSSGYVQGTPSFHSASGVPARTTSVSTGPMGVSGGWSPPNGSTPSMPNAIHGWGQTNTTGQTGAGFASPTAPQTPYKQILPSLLEEMSFGRADSNDSSPPVYQAPPPAFSPPPSLNPMPQGYAQPPYR